MLPQVYAVAYNSPFLCAFGFSVLNGCLFLSFSFFTGIVGLSLSYALALTGTQVMLSRWYCNLSNYMVSVERIKQFMHIPSEPPAIVDGKRPPSSWPSKGRIELQNLKVRKLLIKFIS